MYAYYSKNLETNLIVFCRGKFAQCAIVVGP